MYCYLLSMTKFSGFPLFQIIKTTHLSLVLQYIYNDPFKLAVSSSKFRLIILEFILKICKSAIFITFKKFQVYQHL